ncbi:MAG: hypothetical protein EOM10_17490, partial [Opitutae bacterium]|nr:hypothetical protein [Opitutae bacterium]
AVNPRDGRLVVIEMNPRVSRSSALASKATGFPIAKIAAKLAVGYTLDELPNDITRSTPACFEPSLDYLVVKAPRFAFEKFQGSDDTLTTQMKSVGETMAIGRTFKQALQKALRSLEIGRSGFARKAEAEGALSEDELEAAVARPSPLRLFHVREALFRGWGVERVADQSGMDPWFLRQMEELIAYEEEIGAVRTLAGLEADPARFAQAKEFGFSDRQIAAILGAMEGEVRAARDRLGQKPLVYRHEPGRLLFASELKSLLAVPGLPRELDPQALDDYITYQYVPHPRCIFRGYAKLPPGCYALWQADRLEVHRYWQPNFHLEVERPFEQAAAELRALLTESVRVRLQSDVPLGA